MRVHYSFCLHGWLTKLKPFSDPNSHLNREKMTAEQVYDSDDVFHRFEISKFKKNFASLRNAIDNENRVARTDEITIRRELIAYPRPELNSRGYPFWKDHAASTLLKADIDDGIQDDYTPAQFQLSRPEYTDFPPHVFRKHVYAEERKLREKPGQVVKLRKAAKKNNEKAAKQLKKEWEKRIGDEKFGEALKQFAAININSDDESSSNDSSVEIDSLPSTELRKMKVPDLKERLKSKGLLYTAKKKEDLIKRLLGREVVNESSPTTAPPDTPKSPPNIPPEQIILACPLPIGHSARSNAFTQNAGSWSMPAFNSQGSFQMFCHHLHGRNPLESDLWPRENFLHRTLFKNLKR